MSGTARMRDPGTATYHALARFAAWQLRTLGFVQSVHARRSLACGEIAFGRSDIDLTVVIAPPSDLEDEVACLGRLACRLTTLGRLVPMIGPCEVATPHELEQWYRSPWFPASLERDRGWLRLAGAPFERPADAATPAMVGERSLPWFFWAWQGLADHYRRGRLRTCCNLLLDMVNVYYLCRGDVAGPKRRAEVAAHWADDLGHCEERTQVARIARGRMPRHKRALLRWVYGEALRLGDALAPQVAANLAGRAATPELRTLVPFGYAPRTYLLIDPAHPREIDAALDRMERDPSVLVTTERALRLYLYHRSPWEYFTIRPEPAASGLEAPPPGALRRAIRYYLHRIVPRRVGLAIGTGVDRSRTIGPQYAQARLWLDHGVTAADRDDLLCRFRAAYGEWPYREASTRDQYFSREYPVLCRAIDELTPRCA